MTSQTQAKTAPEIIAEIEAAGPIIPRFVFVEWSESERFEDRSMHRFADFETAAAAAAAGHDTGGYLKTSIVLMFDNGDTYQMRVDLAARDEKGARDAIEKRLSHWGGLSEARRKEEGPVWAGLMAFLDRIDFDAV